MKKSSMELVVPGREERRNFLEEEIRARVRGCIEEMVNEELEEALGIGRYERGDQRKGYRKGKRKRGFTTTNGKHEIAFPRAEFFEPQEGGRKEWNSKLLPRYARRTEEVEEGIMNSYLCGTNTRKIRLALGPLLKGAALSRSTVSRVVARLSEMFEAWRKRDLSEEDIAIVYLDGFNLKIRLCGKVEKVPVLCAIGVRTDGRRILLGLDIRSSESEAAWGGFTEDLCRRGVKSPVLAVMDGSRGLHNAVKAAWPWIEVQRCAKHKLENLYTHAPKRVHDEIKSDYDAIVYADDEKEARAAYKRFERKWGRDCPDAVKSLNEAGEELMTIFKWPKMMRKMLRTTNGIERMNGEFRRRVKTQGSLPNTDAGLKLLYGLFVVGAISLRRIDGYLELPLVVHKKRIEMGLLKVLEEAA